jgi:dihydroneopterin aldolase/2-amino-4-hydroxy-6-hydroxymethyldihydropteridine diphosphokinase
MSAPGTMPVVLALGANLGDPVATLSAAVDQLASTPGLELVAVSPLASTEPVGGPEQPSYLNAVLLARTTLGPRQVLEVAHDIEQRAGRERLVRWGPRTLDVDVIQYGEGRGDGGAVLSADPELTLPHPRAGERAFVLWPWSQVDPAARLVVAEDRELDVAGLAAAAPDRVGVQPGPPWPAGSRAAALVGPARRAEAG